MLTYSTAIDPQIYRGNDLYLSKDGNILYGTVRYRKPKDQDKESETGTGWSDNLEEEEEDEGEEWDEDEDTPNWLGGIFGGNRGSRTSSGPAPTSTSTFGWGGRPSKAKVVRRSLDKNGDYPIIYKETLDEVHYASNVLTKRQYGPAPKPASPFMPKAVPAPQPQPGFLTAVLLSDPAQPSVGNSLNADKGWPLQMIMQAQTATTGGKSNSVAPAPWSNAMFALTDSEIGMVQVWRLDGLLNLPRDGPKSMISQSQPMTGNAPFGAGKSGQRSSTMPPPLANIRANIVAEWRAPPDAVGDPNMIKGSSGRDDNRNRQSGRFVATKTAGRAAVVRRRPQDQLGAGEVWAEESTNALAPIPSGRGCCANPVWYD